MNLKLLTFDFKHNYPIKKAVKYPRQTPSVDHGVCAAEDSFTVQDPLIFFCVWFTRYLL